MANNGKGKTGLTDPEAIEAEITALLAQREQLAIRRQDAVVCEMQEDPEAGARIASIDEQVKALDRRVGDLREAAGQARRLIAAQMDTKAVGAPARIAELAGARLRMAAELHEAAKILAEKAKALRVNGDELAELLDTDRARRWLGFGDFQRRLRSAIAPMFALEANGPRESRSNILGLASDWTGPRHLMTLAQVEQELSDDLARFWATESEASAAAARLALRGEKTIVVPIAGTFTIVAVDRAFGDRRTAEAAADGKPLVVMPYGRGFVLLPQSVAGAEA